MPHALIEIFTLLAMRGGYSTCLLYVNHQKMSNQTLRERFNLPESTAATISTIIGATKEAELIKQDEPESNSTRHTKYSPFWA